MSVEVEVQRVVEAADLPTDDDFCRWVEAALAGVREEAELTVRLVDETESAHLNETYRHHRGPTNVLSFPFEAPPGIPVPPLLGDLVICAPVVAREAAEQGKSLEAHWAHMVVHGTLHLLGYDHIDEQQALAMEGLEVDLLAGLGIPNPYANDGSP
jgi:probable rRNA maturation factor